MRSWWCVNCNKKEVTRFFKPKWVTEAGQHYIHDIWKSLIPDEKDPWDYGHMISCGDVKIARNRKFEGV